MLSVVGVSGRPRIPIAIERAFWQHVRSGLDPLDAGRRVGVSKVTSHRWFGDAGGVIPSRIAEPSGFRLSFAEREEIACLRAAGHGVRQIATRIGRHPSTVSRELKRVWRARSSYRASVAQRDADALAARPKPGKLATHRRLAAEVENRLDQEHSPEQIARRLRVDFPDDTEMHVSHETIYRSIFVQGRGELRKDLHKHLRTGRALRKPGRSTGERRGKIPNMVSISERPAEVEDRAVPGHWEGDLILGAGCKTAIGTLVERSTGFVLLLPLPGQHGAEQVADAMITVMSMLPEILRKTLTWDQGSEMASHARIAKATDLAIYFCDPHSPWQRGSNENTNGLLRQYFPKGADLSLFTPDYLLHVATKLNNRPRKRLDWQTPAETLDQLLSQPFNPPGVAMTA